MHCISRGIFVYVSDVCANAEMSGTRLSDGMQSIFLFFMTPRSESVWGSYDWICVCTGHAIASHQSVGNLVASAIDMVVGTHDNTVTEAMATHVGSMAWNFWVPR